MHQFNEHHPELKGFSEYFDKEILPLLAAQDGQRLEALRNAKFYGVGIAMIAVAVAILGYIISKSPKLPVFAFLGGGAGMFALYARLMKSIRGETKNRIVGDICNYVGWAFQAEAVDIPDLDLLGTYGLLPKGYKKREAGDWSTKKQASFEDQLSGAAHGAQFTSVETHLVYRDEDSRKTAFRGQVITLTFPRKFLGKTVVHRNKGILERKNFGNMKRVGMADPVFEKYFDAFSTDQVEARYLLDPVFIQKIVDLEKSVDGTTIRFGFIEERLFIVIKTPNRFEAGSMLQPLTSPERTQKILDEVGAIYDVVDGVMKPQSR